LRKEREIEIYSDIDFIEDGGSGINCYHGDDGMSDAD